MNHVPYLNVKVPKTPLQPLLLPRQFKYKFLDLLSLFSMPMAAATVDHHLPLIDLRLLSHSELLSLSLCSSSNSIKYDEDDEDSTPKIDASVFNESAGSRKQTFSRLRLAPRNSSPLAPQIPSPAPVKSLDEENLQIVSLLKSLLNIQSHSPTNATDDGEEGQLVPVPVEFEETSNANENGIIGLQNIPVELVRFSEMKRKRGRPRKDERDCGWLIASEDDKNKMMVNVVNEKRKRGRPRKNETTVVVSETETETETVTLTVKRKRGRPRKNLESGVKMISPSDVVACETSKSVESENDEGKMVKDVVTENRNGVVVDLDLDLGPLATVEDDPFWEELRTEGIDKDDQLSPREFWKL